MRKIIDVIQDCLDADKRDLKWLSEETEIKYSSLWYRFGNNKLSGDDLAKIGKVLNIDLNKIKECVE